MLKRLPDGEETARLRCVIMEGSRKACGWGSEAASAEAVAGVGMGGM